MIAREWHGWTTHDNADAYEALLRDYIIPDIEARGIAGYRGVQVLRRNVEDDEVSFKTIFYFESLESVKGFAGDKYRTAYIPEAARPLLKRYDAEATHYEVAIRIDQPRAHMTHLQLDMELRHYIRANLSDFEYHAKPLIDGKRAAAVALTVVHVAERPQVPGIPFEPGWEDHAALLLTRRSAKLKKHAGQWALPGGRIDEGETAEETALRELEEEVGLVCTPIKLSAA